MKWWAKAIAQKILSYFPFGERVNYWLQRNITHTYPISEAELCWKCHDTIQYQQLYETYCQRSIADAHILEIGGGRDLCMPLAFHLLGANHLVVTDLYRQLKLDLLQNIFQRLSEQKEFTQKWKRSFPFRYIATLEALEQLGISYVAPVDILGTNCFQEKSFDLIYSFSTLEHLPQEELLPLFQKFYFLLKTDGVMIHTVNLEDHYAYTDKTLSPYHFLRYSSMTYRWINSSLHYQNRLRYSDYLAVFAKAGLDVCWQDCKHPTTEEIACFQKIPLAQEFSSYPLEDLLVKQFTVVLRKQR